MLLIFGRVTDDFIGQASFDCNTNYTQLSQLYCPPGVILTPENFLQEYTYVSDRNCASAVVGHNHWNLTYFRKCNLSLPSTAQLLPKIRQQSIWLTSECFQTAKSRKATRPVPLCICTNERLSAFRYRTRVIHFVLEEHPIRVVVQHFLSSNSISCVVADTIMARFYSLSHAFSTLIHSSPLNAHRINSWTNDLPF